MTAMRRIPDRQLWGRHWTVRFRDGRAFKWKPLWYLGRVRRRLFGRSVPDDRFRWPEIAGYVSGLLPYLRTRRG